MYKTRKRSKSKNLIFGVLGNTEISTDMQYHTGTFGGIWSIKGIQGNPMKSREIQENKLEYGGIQNIINKGRLS